MPGWMALLCVVAATLSSCVVETGPATQTPVAAAPERLPPNQAVIGKWAGTGYTCPDGSAPAEEIVYVAAKGALIVATKATGDHCVSAGEITWQGAVASRVSPVQIQVGSPNAPRHFVEGTLTVKNLNRLELAGPGWMVAYRRIP